MVITLVKNGSPDMIPTPFDGNFDEKKDEIPPGICRPHVLQIFQYWGFGVDIKHKNDHKCAPTGSPWVRIWHVPYYHIPKYFVIPKGSQFSVNSRFLKVFGGS